MAESKQPRDAIPEQFASIDAAAEFWDSHDLADYDDLIADAEFHVDLQRRRRLIALEPALAERLAAVAHRRGVAAETLINLWLNERLQAVEDTAA
jgi:hypothetical protein